MSLLVARGITHRPLFEGRDLALEAGEIVALSGPSGAGKSLFLRALADLDPADGGEVLLDGTSRAEIAPTTWRARVLYVHQAGVRLPGTVAENLARIAAIALQHGRAAAVATDVRGLAPEADAERLSGGEAQALALHRALACAPRVLLLDEATSAMDPETAGYWEGRVRAFVDAGGGALWVAHDRDLPARVGARAERFP